MRRLIITVVLAVVTATIGTIIVGSRTFDGVVVERPYEAGLAWDETQKGQARLGWRIIVEPAALKLGENDIVLRLFDRNSTPLNDAFVDVSLSRPSTGEYDRTYKAKSLGNGRYQVSFFVPLMGIWDLRTVAARGGESFSSVDRLEAAERTQ